MSPGIQRGLGEIRQLFSLSSFLVKTFYNFCFQIGKHSDSALAAFHKKHVTAERSILVGLNMDFNHLLDYATSLNLEGGAGPAMTDAKFVGGVDVRTDSLGGLAHIAIAADGGNPLASMNEATANYLLKIILGMFYPYNLILHYLDTGDVCKIPKFGGSPKSNYQT